MDKFMINFLYALIGALLVNCIPHLVQGLSGNPFQTPFATPPGVGESSALINLYWGMFNLMAGYGLLRYAGLFKLGMNAKTISLLVGGFILATYLAVHFEQVRHP